MASLRDELANALTALEQARRSGRRPAGGSLSLRRGCDGLIVADECRHVPAAAFEDAVRQIPVRALARPDRHPVPARQARRPHHHAGRPGPAYHHRPPRARQRHPYAARHRPAGRRPAPILRLHPTRYCYTGDASPSAPGGITLIYKGSLIADEQRTRQVIADVTAALSQGRNCFVLTNWTAHLDKLADALRAIGHDPDPAPSSCAAAWAPKHGPPRSPGSSPSLAAHPCLPWRPAHTPGRVRLPPAGHPLPRRTHRPEGTACPVRRPHPPLLRRQGYGRGPRLPRRAHRRARLITGQARTRLYEPGLPRPRKLPYTPSADVATTT